MTTSPAAAAALIDIEMDWRHRQRTAFKTECTPFTLMVANCLYVLRGILCVNERNAARKKT